MLLRQVEGPISLTPTAIVMKTGWIVTIAEVDWAMRS